MGIRNKKKYISFISLFIILLFLFWKKDLQTQFFSHHQNVLHPTSLVKELSVSTRKNTLTKTKTLMSLGSLIQDIIVGRGAQDKLISGLEKLGLSVSSASEQNDATGEMSIIRTHNNLKNIRYIHAQFFSDSFSQDKLQHLSFDYKGEAADLDELSGLMTSTLGIKTQAEISHDGYRLFRLSQSHILWLKLLTLEDYHKLTHDPYKVYKKSDIGKLIRVSVEAEIH